MSKARQSKATYSKAESSWVGVLDGSSSVYTLKWLHFCLRFSFSGLRLSSIWSLCFIALARKRNSSGFHSALCVRRNCKRQPKLTRALQLTHLEYSEPPSSSRVVTATVILASIHNVNREWIAATNGRTDWRTHERTDGRNTTDRLD